MTDNKSFDWEMSYYLTWSRRRGHHQLTRRCALIGTGALSSLCIEHIKIIDGVHLKTGKHIASRIYAVRWNSHNTQRQTAVVSENRQHFLVNFQLFSSMYKGRRKAWLLLTSAACELLSAKKTSHLRSKIWRQFPEVASNTYREKSSKLWARAMIKSLSSERYPKAVYLVFGLLLGGK